MSITAATTFPRLLASLLRVNPGRPLITAYDDTTGERTELSVTTYANWVSKTANLLTDEYLLGEGDTVRLALPPHWLSTVFIGAAWSAGIAITTDPTTAAHLVVRGPEEVHDAGDVPVLACSLKPFAVRFSSTLPDGVDDYGAMWPGQPDVFDAASTPDATTVACRHGSSSHTQEQLIEEAHDAATGWSGSRLMTDVDPADSCGTTVFLSALAHDGSLVMVTGADEEQWPARLLGERATDVLRSMPV